MNRPFVLIPGGKPSTPHISAVPPEHDTDGLCHCDPTPEPSAIGECPTCKRLNPQHARGTALAMAAFDQVQLDEAMAVWARLGALARKKPALFITLGRELEVQAAYHDGAQPCSQCGGPTSHVHGAPCDQCWDKSS